MLLAVANGEDVGVDLEYERNGIHPLTVAGRYFRDVETEAIMAQPNDVRGAVFFRHWVAKEAVLKATGVGLGLPLDKFKIEWARQEDTAHVISFDRQYLDNNWIVRMLNCETGWYAAVSARTARWTLSTQAVAPI